MYNVLLVDDDPMILEGLQYIVDWQGIGLQIAGAVEDGEDALHILRSAHIDILLTDIRMPRVNGLELIEWIRNNQQPVCCIVLSGHDDYEYLHRAFKLGIENYLVKSVNENELQETLLSIVDKLDATGRGMPNTTEDPLLVNVLERWMLGRIRYSEFLERSRLLAFPAFPCRFRISVFRPLVSGVCASARNCKAVTSSFLKMNDIFLQSFVNLDGEIVVIQGNQSAPNLPDLNAIIAELCSMDDFRWVCSSSRSQVGFENSVHQLSQRAPACWTMRYPVPTFLSFLRINFLHRLSFSDWRLIRCVGFWKQVLSPRCAHISGRFCNAHIAPTKSRRKRFWITASTSSFSYLNTPSHTTFISSPSPRPRANCTTSSKHCARQMR